MKNEQQAVRADLLPSSLSWRRRSKSSVVVAMRESQRHHKAHARARQLPQRRVRDVMLASRICLTTKFTVSVTPETRNFLSKEPLERWRKAKRAPLPLISWLVSHVQAPPACLYVVLIPTRLTTFGKVQSNL